MTIELRTKNREMGGDEGNQHEKRRLQRISCTSQFTIPNMAGMSPYPACSHTDTRTPQPNQASHTPDFSYPLQSPMSFSSSSPIALFHIYNSSIIAEQKVESSLSISGCHDHELILSAAYTMYSIHQVHRTPSTPYTEYSIH